MKTGWLARIVTGALLCVAADPRAAGSPLRVASAAAAEGWRAEFDDICARTQDAMTLSSDELKGLVARCDALKPSIDKLDDSQKKVFARRLQQCRDLYQFVLDSRAGGTSG